MKLTHDLEATRKSALAIEAKVDALAKKPEPKKCPHYSNDGDSCVHFHFMGMGWGRNFFDAYRARQWL
jgi:hypothetical protein